MPASKDIRRHIADNLEGKTFVIRDLLEFGNEAAIRMTLTRLEREGFIRRLLPGVYDKPLFCEPIQKYPFPSADKVAESLARKNGWVITIGPDAALNMMGLSTQVPASYVFMSSGNSRNYIYKNINIEFRHCCLLQKTGLTGNAAIALQCIIALGNKLCNNEAIIHIAERLDDKAKLDLFGKKHLIPAWMRKIVEKIYGNEKNA